VFKNAVMAILVCTLAACSSVRPRAPAPQAPRPPEAGLQSLPPPGTYRIDSAGSELRLLVYRAGALANLGHNHVMTNRSVSGFVQIAGSISDSSFSLEVPVDQFAVDDAQARLEEGGEFPGEIPDDAKSGTRHNMMSSAVLNAAEFPIIEVRSTALHGTPDALTADLTVNVAGRQSAISVPLSLAGDSRHMTAAGSIELRQTSIGLKPYSLMHGALQVQDAIRLKFKIVVPIS
jgi:polyisoprenoid-binding protein YceI